jgi:hypothetical protein
MGQFRPTLRVAPAARCLLLPESDLIVARQRNDVTGQIRTLSSVLSYAAHHSLTAK